MGNVIIEGYISSNKGKVYLCGVWGKETNDIHNHFLFNLRTRVVGTNQIMNSFILQLDVEENIVLRENFNV